MLSRPETSTPPEALISLAVALAAQSTDLLWATDPNGHMRLITGSVEQILGLTPEEALASPDLWSRAVHMMDQPDVLHTLQHPEAHPGEGVLTFRVVHSDCQTVHWLRVTLSPIAGKLGRTMGHLGVGRDVTESRALAQQIENEAQGLDTVDAVLRDTRDNTRLLFENASEAIFILEPRSLHIIVHNRQAEVLTGFIGKHLREMTFDELLLPADSKSFRGHLVERRKGSQPPPWRGQASVADGQRVEIEVQASVVEVGQRSVVPCFVRDISERLSTERKVLRFEEILRGISDSTVIFDLEGRVTFANAAAERLWGKTSETWGLVRVWDLYESEIPVMREGETLSLRGKRDHAEGEYELRSQGGDERVCFSSFSLVRDPDREPIGLVAISRDVTGERALQQQILQVQKMDSIGTLAGGVAHDFNNLLGGILGYSQLLRRNLSPDSPMYTQAEFIEQSAIRASQLTQQLLSFSRKGKYNVCVTTLNEIIQSALTLVESSLPKSIMIHTDLEPDPCPIEVDITQIEQIILNLCINARDAMNEAGWITIRARTRDLTDSFCADRLGLCPGVHAVLTVKDSGQGIDPALLPRIFEPFFTTKELGKGTGLGLSVVYGIVKNHGGHIDVDSKVDVGTSFHVYLPATTKPLPAPPYSESESAEGGSEGILVVDDEPTIRELVTDILSAYGYRILRAKDGVEAIDIYRRNRATIGLVLLDMQMPALSGLQTYRRLREINPDVRVILSSGYGMDSDIQDILREGVMAFIQKPYKIHELARIVRENLDKQPSR